MEYIIIYLVINNNYILFLAAYDEPRSLPNLKRSRSRPPLIQQRQVMGSPNPSPTISRNNSQEPLYKSTSLETRSRTPSPSETTNQQSFDYYGTANLTDRSRSPSPTSGGKSGSGKRTGGRKLPTLPSKPSSLNITTAQQSPHDYMPKVLPSPTVPQPQKSPGSINFPKLSASPTHKTGHGLPTQYPPTTSHQHHRHHRHLTPSSSYSPTEPLPPPPHRHTPRKATLPGSFTGYTDKTTGNFRNDDQELEMMSKSSETVPNGFKPRRFSTSGDSQRKYRDGNQSDSNDDDWF